MTVAPRYAAYADALPTGVEVPLQLPPCCHGSCSIAARPQGPAVQRKPAVYTTSGPVRPSSVGDWSAANLSTSTSDPPSADRHGNQRAASYYLCRKAGVDRVFVDHPVYMGTKDVYGPSNNSTYTEGNQVPNLDIRYSILCQAALAAPPLLWGCNRPSFGDSAGQLDAPACGEQLEGFSAALGMENGGPQTDEAAKLSMPHPVSGSNWPSAERTCSPVEPGQAALRWQAGSDITFIGNDWPCAPLSLRMQHILRCNDGGLVNGSLDKTRRDGHGNWGAGGLPIAGASEVGREAGILCEACAFQAPLGRALCRARVAFCIHNLAYQGVLPTAAFPQLCLPPAALASLQQPQAHVAVQQSASPEEAEAGEPSQACVSESTFTGQDNADIEQEEPDHSLSATKQTRAEATIVQLDHAAATSLNWMHAALQGSDMVVTVSPNYAREICELDSMACGMREVLVAAGVRGIMNGLDIDEWNPHSDTLLPPEVQCAPGLEGLQAAKAAAKAVLQARLGLHATPHAPLLIYVGRLTDQKGVATLLGAAPALLGPAPVPSPTGDLQAATPFDLLSPGPQLVILGTGEPWMERALNSLEAAYPGKGAGIPRFDEAMAHLLMLAADFVLIPSLFEPCGLVAQAAVRYGSIPIVTPVGGLADLVGPQVGFQIQSSAEGLGEAEGRRAAVRDLVRTVRTALDQYGTAAHVAMQECCLQLNVSWQHPAAEWESALQHLQNQPLHT